MTQSGLTRRRFLQASLLAAGSPLAGRMPRAQAGERDERPNILWLTCEDIGPHLGCYGDAYAHTPNIDAFASEALRYDVAWSNAPVCSPARTALITGMYPPSLGAHNHRSWVDMPEDAVMFPALLRAQGYYTTNNVKEDYNARPGDDVWDESSDEAHWRNRGEGQPFFAVFNSTLSHGGQIRQRTDLPYHDPAEAPLPPYHPDTPEFRRDWAQYYHSITRMDEWFGEMMEELRADGLLEDTIVFFFGDHGSGMPRHKQLAYNTGLHVPFLVHVPEKFRDLAPADYAPGGATDRLISFVDLAPAVLSLAGAEPPEWMQGRAFMGLHEAEPRTHVFGFRGRMDERQDLVRSVRDGRYIYVRNYMPHLMHGHFSHYMYTLESARAWRRLYEEGALEGPQARVFEPKPPEELYDLETDPHEIENLVESEAHQKILAELRKTHQQHMRETRDLAFLPEAEMHRRAKDSTAPAWELEDAQSPGDMARDSAAYPFERIFAIAELAAGRSPEAVRALRLATNGGDPAVRYWALMGLLIRGQGAAEAAWSRVQAALDDPNPSVRVVAAEIMARHGAAEEAESGVDALGALARPDENGAYVAMEALTAIQNLGERAERLHSALLDMPHEDPEAPWRGTNEFVVRLLPDYVHPALS